MFIACIFKNGWQVHSKKQEERSLAELLNSAVVDEGSEEGPTAVPGDTGILEDEFVLNPEGVVLLAMNVDSRLDNAIRQFRNPESGYAPIEIFQRVYMGYDPETSLSRYGARLIDTGMISSTYQRVN